MTYKPTCPYCKREVTEGSLAKHIPPCDDNPHKREKPLE